MTEKGSSEKNSLFFQVYNRLTIDLIREQEDKLWLKRKGHPIFISIPVLKTHGLCIPADECTGEPESFR